MIAPFPNVIAGGLRASQGSQAGFKYWVSLTIPTLFGEAGHSEGQGEACDTPSPC